LPAALVVIVKEQAMRPCLTLLLPALMLAGLTACEHKPSKEEEEAVKNTFACQLAGERTVIRFAPGEARILTSSGEKITLYQIAASGGLSRYTNGNVELRGKGDELTLIEFGVTSRLDDCKPYSVPKP
jgi:hypothetical protein